MGEPYRVLPRVTSSDRHFWTGGARGELQILRCQESGFWIHPPLPRCPECLSVQLVPEVTSGKGVVHAFTVNHHPWNPTYEDPYVIAVVELAEQPDLRVTTNILNCDPDDVHIGMPVRALFIQEEEELWLPMFEPDPTAVA